MEDNITSRPVPFLVVTFGNDPNDLTTVFYMMRVSDIIDPNAEEDVAAKAATEAKTETVVKAASVDATAAAA